MTQKHSFYIPVMGTGFTIDTPLKVAHLGITSVVSIADDILIEKMREYHSRLEGVDYQPIVSGQPDARARRITAYLDFLQERVQKNFKEVQASEFLPGSLISRYFELLDDESSLKKQYRGMLDERSQAEKIRRQKNLRDQIKPGSIDVNIMVKADRCRDGQARQSSDALSSFRGFANSSLDSAVVFSAGVNPVLYTYVSEFPEFFADSNGFAKKRIIIKVSDFRSAQTQGKIFAKKGIWVSEYRIESGLNCGGHAFPTQGDLMSSVLETFKQNRESMREELWEIYEKSVQKLNLTVPKGPLGFRITAQGGIGTSAEQKFLIRYYGLDAVGWGSPFLLVPEVTSVDEQSLGRLADAGEKDIVLSGASPLGVPFYTLKRSQSEERRRHRISEGRPGSPCTNGFLAFDKEFGAPLCTASRRYQFLKLKQIDESNIEPVQKADLCAKVVEKACICRDLSGGAIIKNKLDKPNEQWASAVCPGPNLAFFSKICSLKEMVDHIYGRSSVLPEKILRPHLLINEAKLYFSYLKKMAVESMRGSAQEVPGDKMEYMRGFVLNLKENITHLKSIQAQLNEELEESKEVFMSNINQLLSEINIFENKYLTVLAH